MGFFPASMARSRTEGIFSPGFHVPLVMRDPEGVGELDPDGAVSSMRIDVSTVSVIIH